MARVDPNTVYDGFQAITDGINSGEPAFMLPSTQAAWGVNATFRGYIPQSRPGWYKRTLKFLNADGTTNSSLRTNFQAYIFQGAACFERKSEIVASVGGRLFRIRLDHWDVLDITTPTTNSAANYRCWFAEAEDFLIVQDGSSQPWIYDGSTNRRSDTIGTGGTKEVPVGRAMVYSNGRLIVVLADGQQFVVGDIVNGPSGTAAYNYRDAVLKFTENDIINEGGAFSVSAASGQITAVRPVAQVDTSTGQGPTQIFTTQAIYSLNAPTDRTIWKDVEFPIGTVSLISNGALSDRATINVNGDIWSRSLDGVRSFVVARRDFGTWVNTPLSDEVDRTLSRDDKALLSYSSAALFDNRLLMTTRPYRSFSHGVPHRGLVAIDFSPVSFLGAPKRPVWEGLWTGLNILQVLSGTFNGVERCFAFALSESNNIELWELTRNAPHDFDGTDDVRIQWAWETGSYKFPDAGFNMKKLSKAWVWLNELDGLVEITTRYRANEDPCWHLWEEWQVCSTMETCGTTRCLTPQNLHQQYRRPFLLTEPSGAADDATGIPDHIGESFQVRFEIEGRCAMPRFLIAAREEQQDVVGTGPTDTACVRVNCCPPDDFAYVLSSAGPVPEGGGSSDEDPDEPLPGPNWPSYPNEPPGWPPVPPPPPLEADSPWPPYPPEIVPTWEPPTYEPVLGCSGSQSSFGWSLESGGISRPVRFVNSGIESSNPNSIFDGDLIEWWKAHVQAAFLADMLNSGITVQSYELYWYWNTTAASWSVENIYNADSYTLYVSPGWELWITYCTP